MSEASGIRADIAVDLKPPDPFGHHEYMRDLVSAAEEVGAYVVSIGPGHERPVISVVLEWTGRRYVRLTVEDIFPADVIRRLPRFNEDSR